MAYECMSFLPDLTDAQIAKQVDYMIGNGWTPCVNTRTATRPSPRSTPSSAPATTTTATGTCGSCPSSAHRRDPGHLRDQGVPPALPRRHRPRDRLRPPAPGAVRRVHRPEVSPRASVALRARSY